MKVTIVEYEDLPVLIRKSMPNNGPGREWANYLRVEHAGTMRYYSDAMESEDARFTRDLGWIKGAIEEAYRAGLRTV